MAQRTLTAYTRTIVRHVFVPMNKRYDERRGLSERVLRQRLERHGWTVWRSASIGAHKNPEAWPNVRRKYAALHDLLSSQWNPDELEYLARVHHGLPDFLCHRRKEWKFVECKLGHEQLSERQKTCIRRLQHLGFLVEVHKLAEPCTKLREAVVTLETGEKIVREKQLRIKQKY